MGNKRKRSSLHRFYLIEPKPNANADALADQLIALKNVEEVYVADGDYGFIVKVKFFDGNEPSDVINYLKGTINKFGVVNSYYQYRK